MSDNARDGHGPIDRVNVADLLRRSAARQPSHEFVCDGDRLWSYGEFDAWTNRVAGGLASLGLRAGDAVLLMSGNRAEFLVTYLACARSGLVCVPVNLLWKQAELAHVVQHSAARAAVVEDGLVGQFQAACPAAALVATIVIASNGSTGSGAADAPGLLDFTELTDGRVSTTPVVTLADRAPVSYLYTSGTTSAPKGVVASHLAIYLEALGVALDMRLTAHDRVSVVLPMFHTAQLNALCTPAIAVGASMVIQRGFDATAMHDMLERERMTVFFGLPMMVEKLVQQQTDRPRDLGALRLVIYAMAAMPEALLRRAIDVLGCEFCLLFGQTEMSPTAAVFRPEHQLSHPGAVGTPGVNVEIAILDLDGTSLPAGQTGEIAYRSPQVMSGYLNNPAATEEAFRDGWFHSGDAGHFDEDGLLWFEDRFKDIIKSGGENVSSIEVELALRAAGPDLVDVAVIGLPHPHWGEAITAVVVGPGRLDSARLVTEVRQRLSPFKCPKAVIVLPELPRTATGKIQKARLRSVYADFYRSEATLPILPAGET